MKSHLDGACAEGPLSIGTTAVTGAEAAYSQSVQHNGEGAVHLRRGSLVSVGLCLASRRDNGSPCWSWVINTDDLMLLD